MHPAERVETCVLMFLVVRLSSTYPPPAMVIALVHESVSPNENGTTAIDMHTTSKGLANAKNVLAGFCQEWPKTAV